MRLMFIITALAADTRAQATLEWDGINVLTEVIKDVIAADGVRVTYFNRCGSVSNHRAIYNSFITATVSVDAMIFIYVLSL